MPDKIILTLNLIKATSIEQFRLKSGARAMHMHYYQLSLDGEVLMRWIEADTDSKALDKLIKAGRIFLIEDS